MITAELDIEVNSLAFRLQVEDNEAIVLLDRWRDCLTLTKFIVADSKILKSTLRELDTELKRLNITLFMRKRGFAVLGTKANPIYAFLTKKIIPVFIN